MTIKYTKINLSDIFPSRKDAYAVVLDNVFTEQECQDLINLTEKSGSGYIDALVGGNQTRDTSQRNNTRCIIDDPNLASSIFERIKKYIPNKWLGNNRVGLNERLRFLKYTPNQYFKPHNDGIYIKEDKTQCSYITIHLYLNTVNNSGATTFTTAPMTYGRHNLKKVTEELKELAVFPVVGRVLIFEHHLPHEGSILKDGVKYTMRTDVMYDLNGKKPIRNSRWQSSFPHPQYKLK